MPDFLSTKELADAGFAGVGDNVRISRMAQFYGREYIVIGSNVRVDAFAIITAGPSPVVFGSYCHVAAHTYVSGAQGGATLGYGSGLAPFCALYTAVEDYSTGALTSPAIPLDLRRPKVDRIDIGPHVVVGSSSVILAGVRLGFGCSVGALSLVHRDVRAYEVVHGNPIQRVNDRDHEVLQEFDRSLRHRAAADGIDLPDPVY